MMEKMEKSMLLDCGSNELSSSIESKAEGGPPSAVDESKTMLLSIKLFISFVALMFILSAKSRINTDESGMLATALNNGHNLTNTTPEVPSYLTVLAPDEYDHNEFDVNSSYIIGEPGEGNIVKGEAKVVRFNEPTFVFRTYGGEGKAQQCGYWWVLNPPSGSKDTYFEHFAICPEFNDATYIVRCLVPTNFTAIVGEGQSIDCVEGDPTTRLTPDSWNLQMNADVCSGVTKMEKHLACSYCSTDQFALEDSACSNEGSNYIDGFVYDPDDT